MKETRKLTLTAFFLALGFVLPFLTGQIPQIGATLLPMHIPVLLCGFFCGSLYGGITGFLLPLVRSLWLGRPILLPTAVAMAVELAVYGVLTGLLYPRWKEKRFGVYAALLTAMLGGRIAWGLVSMLLYRILADTFTWEMFAAGALLQAVPGICVQLVLVPAIVHKLKKHM